MHVLLTGNNGYIGRIMVPMLLDYGHEVTGMDCDLYRECTYGVENKARIPEIKKDIRDVDASDLDGFDAVIHLAGLSNDPLGDLNPAITMEVNHAASVRLAHLAKKAGIRRFIFSSSCSSYGAGGADWVNEEGAVNPVTPYGVSKVCVERDIRALADDSFSPTFARSATAYGMSPRIRFDLVLNNLVAWAYTTGAVYLKSDGTAWRPIVHIEDISRAFGEILQAPRENVHCQTFNIGMTGENYRIRELASVVADVVPGAAIHFADGAGTDTRCYRVNCDKIASMLPGFQPKWTARRGAEELYASFVTHGLSLEDFEGVRFKRVAHIRHLIESGRLQENLRWYAP